MTNRQRINYINKTLEKVELYYRLMGKVSFDMQCIAPKKGLQRASDDINKISSIPFKLMHSKKFMSTVDELYLNHEGLNEYEVKLISNLHESKEKSKNITPKMQDEVHRYAITFHKYKRGKGLTSSIYDDIKGIGKKRKESLEKAFPSLDSLKKASLEELSQIVPLEIALKIKEKIK